MAVKISFSNKEELSKGLTFVDTTINMCKLERGSIVRIGMKPIFEELKRSSNLTWKCPFKKVTNF